MARVLHALRILSRRLDLPARARRWGWRLAVGLLALVLLLAYAPGWLALGVGLAFALALLRGLKWLMGDYAGR